jgi:hypothetical protein
MQRALLAAEDLGGLIHAFRSRDPWTALRATTIDRIDEAFMWAGGQRKEALVKLFVLADRQLLEAGGYADRDIEILLRARDRVIQRWARMLSTAGSLWLSLRAAAKVTMHGFPMLQVHLIDPAQHATEASFDSRVASYGNLEHTLESVAWRHLDKRNCARLASIIVVEAWT